MKENTKWFEEPEFEVVVLKVADVITTSEGDGDPDWGMGDF